jgi:hypothetical protein
MIGRRGVGINSSYILQQKDQYSQLERQMWLQFITIYLKMCIPANANNIALKFMSKATRHQCVDCVCVDICQVTWHIKIGLSH